MFTAIMLPPAQILARAAATLVERTTDARGQALLNKAIYFLGRNAEIVPTSGGFLIPSSDRRNVYRVDNIRGCRCRG